ncbi:MAG: GumC family protein, partial [Geminicoccaceae bacterium]
QVVDRLGLIDDPEFNPSLREPSTLARHFYEIAGDWMRTDGAAATGALAAAANPSETDQIAKINVAANVLENLSVWNEGRSYTIFTSFHSEDSAKAAEITNAFVDAYMQRQLDADAETTERVSSWLDRRLKQARRQVRVAEAEIEAFREANQLVDLGEEGSLARQQLGEINRQLAEVGARRSDLEARLSHGLELIANDSPFGIPEVIASSVVQQLRSEVAVLDRRRAEISSIYGSNHPERKAIEAEITRLERKVEVEVANIMKGMTAELDVTLDRLSRLDGSLATLTTTVGDVDKANAKLRELEREADASRALFESLAKRNEQAAALQDAQQSYAVLVAPAVPPHEPSHPNKIAVAGLSMAIGLGFSLLLIAVFEYRDRDRLRTPGQLEGAFGLPCYGMAPELGSASSRSWFSWLKRDPIDGVAVHTGAIRRIRNAVYRDSQGKSPFLIMVTSSLPAEGKSTFSAEIAQAFVGAGQRTLLVDADVHRLRISKLLELEDPSADDAGEVDLRRAITTKGRLDVLLLTKAVNKDAEDEDLAAHKLLLRIERQAQDYDVVVIDTPPVVLMDDASLIADIADSVVYLVRWNKTPIEAVQTGIGRLRSSQTRPPIGLVLSRTDLARHVRFGHKDESYFSEQYGYYYRRA